MKISLCNGSEKVSPVECRCRAARGGICPSKLTSADQLKGLHFLPLNGTFLTFAIRAAIRSSNDMWAIPVLSVVTSLFDCTTWELIYGTHRARRIPDPVNNVELAPCGLGTRHASKVARSGI